MKGKEKEKAIKVEGITEGGREAFSRLVTAVVDAQASKVGTKEITERNTLGTQDGQRRADADVRACKIGRFMFAYDIFFLR